jgi:nanoRNase/pAp phosphatase (c-di-AMP/oligoRNAs hydrolase)
MKCFYHNDLDGKCAAFLVCNRNRLFPFVECISMDYSKNPDLKSIIKNETVYIVDYHFKDNVMEKLLKITKSVIWIDHHKTIIDSKYNNKEIKGIRSIEKSGCELTWDYLYTGMYICVFVKLIGDYDTWRFKYGNRTEAFHEGMMLYETNPEDKIWKALYESSTLHNDIIRKGEDCIRYRENFCKQYLNDYNFEMKYEGYKCLVCNLHRFGSKTFGDKIKEYDIVITCVFNGQQWIHGLYTIKENIDVSKIAKKHGGGGHKGAAGFIFEYPIWELVLK